MAIKQTCLPLVTPRCAPELDPQFRPAALAVRAFRAAARQAGSPRPVRLALEQTDGAVYHFQTEIFPEAAHQADADYEHLERIVKFLLWSRGGWRLHVDGPADLVARLAAHYRESATGKFDAETVGLRMFDHPIEVVHRRELPPERLLTQPLGRHLEGCRIGFDLGGSDRKAAAVIDGKVVFSEETEWNPYFQTDPQYHLDGIMDSLRKAAAHLPRVDAIGGSAAGVYVNNRVKVASLFRGVPAEVFQSRVRDLFLEVQRRWNVPLVVVNDGEVTALAASMSLGVNSVLGISLGTSTAGGWVNAEGNITTWLNELAFVPVDYHPDAPRDEWSGDRGCGVQYFSQQCVGRLLAPAGIAAPADMPLPEKLKQVQALMQQGDERARKIYQTIGVYLGYGIAHFADFYDLRHVLILGRVTSGAGGDLMLAGARNVLQLEFPELAKQIAFHIPDEKDKRHGQAIAAASLPDLKAKSS
ncbi:MAG TPA: ROK family protein [Verrucomicrobiota bacterium]|nr:ROK family protein [Verrucomicrobiota bacterium]HNT16175.1 ROK family protein [Verrucomicrobiota bacterium]